VVDGGIPTGIDIDAARDAGRATTARLCERAGLEPAGGWPIVN
jgi:hypothetical protein